MSRELGKDVQGYERPTTGKGKRMLSPRFAMNKNESCTISLEILIILSLLIDLL